MIMSKVLIHVNRIGVRNKYVKHLHRIIRDKMSKQKKSG